MFGELDRLTEQHGIEKIKTIGDAYMAAADIPSKRDDHLVAAVDFAKMTIARLEDSKVSESGLKIRAGIHTGPMIAGLIGRTRSTYDVWGATVNLANRLEPSGMAKKSMFRRQRCWLH